MVLVLELTGGNGTTIPAGGAAAGGGGIWYPSGMLPYPVGYGMVWYGMAPAHWLRNRRRLTFR